MAETTRRDGAGTTWRRARCGGSGCVEVARIRNTVGVRDSKHPDGPVLRYSPEEFRAFVAAVKAGDFDDLFD
jgi:hypothetical protein